MNYINLVIWDWNGTLLNDVDICVESMNSLLKKYGYDKKLTVDEYRKIFTFPVKNYYQKVGFDFEKHPFDIVGLEFIEIYNQKINNCSLQPNAIEVLEFFKNKNLKQIIISARENEALNSDLKSLKIEQYFDLIQGISNHFAKGKQILFELFFSENNIDKSKVLLIGDTVHDYEIAKKLNLNFILFTKGHQDESHFIDENLITINDLKELINTLI